MADLTTTVVLTHGGKDSQQSKGYRMEESIDVKNLRTEGGDTDTPEARVPQAVSTKISDAVYYGQGTWGKGPYTVEVFSSVSLVCDQEPSKLEEAQNKAHQLAFESAHERLQVSLVGHINNIRNNLYKGYFDED